MSKSKCFFKKEGNICFFQKIHAIMITQRGDSLPHTVLNMKWMEEFAWKKHKEI